MLSPSHLFVYSLRISEPEREQDRERDREREREISPDLHINTLHASKLASERTSECDRFSTNHRHKYISFPLWRVFHLLNGSPSLHFFSFH